MYSFSYLEPVSCSKSTSNCCFLTCIQIPQEAGQVVWNSHLFQNFPQVAVIHTVKGFGIVNKAEIDVFLELSCFFNDPADVGNLISGSSAFSKTSLNIRNFMVRILLKPGLENFEHHFTSVWDECNCAVVWAFFGIAFLRDWNENWPFTALSNSMKLSHAVWGHPRWVDPGGEVWQNVVHWRREWQTTSVLLPWEPHEQRSRDKHIMTQQLLYISLYVAWRWIQMCQFLSVKEIFFAMIICEQGKP